jgi:ABC-type Na+ efflux pump permease subunit
MSDQSVSNPQEQRSGSSSSASPAWWLVLKQEFTDLWMGGRVLLLLIIFSLLMSITSVMNEVESQLSLIPPAEMVYLTLVGSLSFGLLIGLILGADSISGERDRLTLEALLLTPASRRQIVLGKLLAALSPWPVALLLSIPYMAVLSRGHEVFGQAIIAGAVLGTVLAVAFTGFGMLTSIWSKSNKGSLLACLLVYVIFLIPTQFPAGAQKGDLGYFVQQLNPLQATSAFLEKILVNNRTLAEMSNYLVATALSAIVVIGLLFLNAAPRLSLDGGLPSLTSRRRRAASSLTGIGAMLLLALPVAMAVQTAPAAGADPERDPASSRRSRTPGRPARLRCWPASARSGPTAGPTPGASRRR